MPPNPMEFSFSEILSLPFILPDCSTWTACTAADAPRGMTIEPPIMTGSSTIALNVWPACETSTSIAWVSRTFSAVPAGTVTGFGAAARRRLGCRRRCWRRAAVRRLARRELDRDRLLERDLGHLPVVEQHADGLAVAADEHAFDDLARSQPDPVGRRATRRSPTHSSIAAIHRASSDRHLMILFRHWTIGSAAEICRSIDQQQLVLDLQEPQRRARRQRRP